MYDSVLHSACRRLPRRLIASLLALCAAALHADPITQAPAQLMSLPDGVRLVLKPEPTTEITAITLFVHTPRDRDDREAAVGEMVSHALFYGSTDSSRDSIALSVAQVGGVLETLRTPDYVAVTVVTVPEQIEEAASLLGEALKHADFTPDALQRGLHDIRADRKRQSENGYETGSARIRAMLGTALTPSDDRLRRVTQTQAQSYFATRYVPAQTVISVVGRFSPRSVETAFTAYLAEYVRPSVYRTGGTEADFSGSPVTPTESVPLSVGTAGYALVGVAAPTIDSPDAPAFALLDALIGSGHASRLFRHVRDSLGIGYDIGAVYRPDLADPLIAYLQWDTQRTDAAAATGRLTPADALTRLNRELDGILTDLPGNTEVERARNVAIGRDALRHERARDRSFLLGWYEAMGLGYEFDAEFPRRLAGVTRADVLRVAAKYLPHRAAVTVAPKLE